MSDGTGPTGAAVRPRSAGVSVGDLVELVRLPAVLSVPGDALLGAAASGSLRGGRLAAPAALLYLAGMALNDWADRVEDALERPSRPVPSGRVSADTARRVATALTAAGLAAAAALGGRPGLLRAVPLGAAVWAYDLGGKRGAAGPVLMATCRALDVTLGAAGARWERALPYAAVVAAHTATLSEVSRHETTGGDPRVPQQARRRTLTLAGLSAAGVLAAAPGRRDRGATAVALVLLARYAVDVGGAFDRAAADPTPEALQDAVGSAVAGLVPLQAGLLAAAGALPAAALLVTAPPLLRPLAASLARSRSVS